jgi:hypothetical protein
MVVRKQSRQRKEISLRHVWLASLGAAVVARREARNTVGSAIDEADRLRGRAVRLADDAGAVARGALATVRERVEPTIARLGAEVEARIAPVLEKLGVAKPTPARPARRTRKPAAKKATRRPAAARRQADLRIARKGR